MTLESVDDRMVGLTRLILAASALLIIFIDPSEPDRLVAVTYGALVVYTIYSATVYILVFRRRSMLLNRVAHWVDIVSYLVIIALSSGTSSIFFFFFFFAILVASFRHGFSQGLYATLASAILFTAVGYVTAPARPHFELNRFLLRPVYMLVLGYMMAYWGGREIRLKRRLSILKEITGLSNPRFGVSYLIGSMSKKLRDFYEAESCLLVLLEPLNNELRLFRLEREQTAESVQAEVLPPKLAELLLSLPENIAIVFGGRSTTRLRHDVAFDLTTKRDCTEEWRETGATISAKLEMKSYITVPMHYRGKAVGRLYLTARRGVFVNSDIGFLMQIVEQIMPLVHNIRLLSQFASNAAEQERKRLARDIHDSVIQPYIGLQYKIAAVRNKIVAGNGDVSRDIEQLFQMTVDEVSSLRGFVRDLRDISGSGDDFLSAVRRFAEQFAANYDLHVQVESKGNIAINDRIAAELIKIIHEGLSNIRKHTQATASKITLERTDTSFQMCIENDDAAAAGPTTPSAFSPASITERVAELGGDVKVERNPEGHTLVKVVIPM
jgi:signal transduction histidine kinase